MLDGKALLLMPKPRSWNRRCSAMSLGFVLLLWAFSLVSISRCDPVNFKAPISCTAGQEAACSAYLFYPFDRDPGPDRVAKLFNVTEVVPFVEERSLRGYYVDVKCSCMRSLMLATTYYTVTSEDRDGVDAISRMHFNNMVWIEDNSTLIKSGETKELQLLCACSPPNTTWEHVLTYTVASQDVLFAIAERFGSTVEDIVSLNRIPNPDDIRAGDQVLFVPIRSLRTEGVPLQGGGKSRKRLTLVLVVVLVSASCFLVASWYYFYGRRQQSSNNKLEVAPSFRNSGGFALSWGSINDNGTRAGEAANSVFGVSEKPVVFSLEEVKAATMEFNEASKIGEGAFGSVYHGKLRNQDVAIKQMKASKSKEFFAELKVLCRVHHTNLVELIGYAVGDENLFLVYELAENGALSDHLHNHTSKGHQVLAWTTRVQIAVDAARGLEYIHEHTKAHYVHRDIKSSNILLDASLRAKVADFGLAKLAHRSVEGESDQGQTTGVVGTFGYLAPEYVRAGHATSKSDVYAFGVVLMELITGQEALLTIKDASQGARPLKRSLTSTMLPTLQDKGSNLERFQRLVDPNLEQNYPVEIAARMAMLAKCCTEEEALGRPDMKQVVLSLSHILLASIEWEASLAGSSQIFSGIMLGR